MFVSLFEFSYQNDAVMQKKLSSNPTILLTTAICFYIKMFFLRNNVGGPTSSIAGFCSYFFDSDKQIVLDRLYDGPSNTTRDLLTLTQLTGIYPAFMLPKF